MSAKDLAQELLDQYAFNNLYVDCPECANIGDDQYQCTTCGCGGGAGSISVESIVSDLVSAIPDKN